MTPLAARYTCVLRWKQGERLALANLDTPGLIRVVPLIEPTPMAFASAKSPDEFRAQLRKTIVSIGQCWGSRPCFIDDHLIAPLGTSFGLRPLEYLVREARGYGLSVAPILRLSDSGALGTSLVAGRTAEETVGLRAVLDAPETSASTIVTALSSWGVSPSHVHLFVDQGFVESEDSSDGRLFGLPWMAGWRGITVLGGSFPRDLRDFSPDVHVVPRYEWGRFLSLLAKWPSAAPTIGFGDYGTIHARFTEPEPGCRPSASVRYALDDTWLVLRGFAVSNKEAGGFEQFRGHAMYLMRHPGYSGRPFSFGDRYIAERCRPGASTGNLTTWLAASMNHHMVRTCSNLAARVADRVAIVADARRIRLPAGTATTQAGTLGPRPIRP